MPRADFMANQIRTRLNGTLPLGLVRRCTRLLDHAGHTDVASRLRAECDTVRGRLDAGLADPAAMVSARADGAQLATRAASALVAAGGGPSLLGTHHAQRLAREAIFTLVAASRLRGSSASSSTACRRADRGADPHADLPRGATHLPRDAPHDPGRPGR